MLSSRFSSIFATFTIITCSNGKFQLRRPGALLGAFSTLEAAKGKAVNLAPSDPTPPAEPSTPAIAPTLNAAKAGRPAGLKHHKLLGFSACAVAKALGRAGIKFDDADPILRRQGIAMTRPSLTVQLGFGRNPDSWEHHGQPAGLPESQLSEPRATVLA